MYFLFFLFFFFNFNQFHFAVHVNFKYSVTTNFTGDRRCWSFHNWSLPVAWTSGGACGRGVEVFLRNNILLRRSLCCWSVGVFWEIGWCGDDHMVLLRVYQCVVRLAWFFLCVFYGVYRVFLVLLVWVFITVCVSIYVGASGESSIGISHWSMFISGEILVWQSSLKLVLKMSTWLRKVSSEGMLK